MSGPLWRGLHLVRALPGVRLPLRGIRVPLRDGLRNALLPAVWGGFGPKFYFVFFIPIIPFFKKKSGELRSLLRGGPAVG